MQQWRDTLVDRWIAQTRYDMVLLGQKQDLRGSKITRLLKSSASDGLWSHKLHFSFVRRGNFFEGE
jgi:hypothetical protein